MKKLLCGGLLAAFLSANAGDFVPCVASFALTFQNQSGSTLSGTVLTTWQPMVFKLTSKELLLRIAAAKHQAGHYGFNEFPAGCVLSFMFDPYSTNGHFAVTLNGEEVLNVSDVIGIHTIANVYQEKYEKVLDLYLSHKAQSLVRITYDDTWAGGGLNFSATGVLSSSITDKAITQAVYSEKFSGKATLAGSNGDNQIVTGSFSLSGTGNIDH